MRAVHNTDLQAGRPHYAPASSSQTKTFGNPVQARQLQLDRLNCLKLQLQARLVSKSAEVYACVHSKLQAAHISRLHIVADCAEPRAAARWNWRVERALTT